MGKVARLHHGDLGDALAGHAPAGLVDVRFARGVAGGSVTERGAILRKLRLHHLSIDSASVRIPAMSPASLARFGHRSWNTRLPASAFKACHTS